MLNEPIIEIHTINLHIVAKPFSNSLHCTHSTHLHPSNPTSNCQPKFPFIVSFLLSYLFRESYKFQNQIPLNPFNERCKSHNNKNE